MLSEPDRDMEKLGGDHKTRRTAAIASLKVGWCLLYQAAGWGRRPCWVSASDHVPRWSPESRGRAAPVSCAGWPNPTIAAASQRPDVHVLPGRLSRSAIGTRSV